MAGPSRIQIAFEPDKHSVGSFNTEIGKAISEGVKTGVTEGLRSAFSGADFSAAATKFADSMNKAVGEVKWDKLFDFGDKFGGVTDVVNQLLAELGRVKTALIDINKSLVGDLAGGGTENIKSIIASLEELNGVVSKISEKNFSITNMFSYSGSKAANSNIQVYRDQANALIATLKELYNTMMNSSAIGKVAVQANKALDGFDIDAMSKNANRSNIRTDTLQNLIADGMKAKSVLEELIATESKFDAAIQLPDMSGLDAATQRVAEFEARAKQTEQTMIDAAEATTKMAQAAGALGGQGGAGTAAGGGVKLGFAETEEGAAKVKALVIEINDLFSTLGKTIRESLDMTQPVAEVERLRTALDGIKSSLGAIERATKKTMSDEERAAKAVADANKKIVLAQDKTVTKEYQGATSKTAEIEQLNALADAYKKYEVAVNNIRSGASPATDENVAEVNKLRDALLQQIEALKQSTSAHQENAGAASRDAASAATVAKQAANLSRQITMQLRTVPGLEGSQWGEQLKQLREELSGKDIDPTRLKEIAAAVAQIKQQYTEAGYAGSGFFSTLTTGLRNVAGFTAMVAAMRKVIQVTREMISAIKEIDLAMTELKKVTDLTASGYKDFYKDAVAASRQIGATVSDTINATAD